MQFFIGTSGFSFDGWKGEFYPSDLPSSKMLTFYAERLPSVEINNTFYRMPRAEALAPWYERVPDTFNFAIKAPRRITHQQKLRGAEQSLQYLFAACEALKNKLGPVLFQLPPFFKKDAGCLREFLAALGDAAGRAAFEFRHPSWFDDEIHAVLAERKSALVAGDPDDSDIELPLLATAPFGYLRLRAPAYSDADLEQWADRIRAEPWERAFVYFKHEIQGPALAQKLLARLVTANTRP